MRFHAQKITRPLSEKNVTPVIDDLSAYDSHQNGYLAYFTTVRSGDILPNDTENCLGDYSERIRQSIPIDAWINLEDCTDKVRKDIISVGDLLGSTAIAKLASGNSTVKLSGLLCQNSTSCLTSLPKLTAQSETNVRQKSLSSFCHPWPNFFS